MLHQSLLANELAQPTTLFFTPPNTVEYLEKKKNLIENQLDLLEADKHKTVLLLNTIRGTLPLEVSNQLDFKQIDEHLYQIKKENALLCCCLFTSITAGMVLLETGIFALLGKISSGGLISSVSEGAKIGAELGLKTGSLFGCITSTTATTIHCYCKNGQCSCGAKRLSAYFEKIETAMYAGVKKYNETDNLELKKQAIIEIQNAIDKPFSQIASSAEQMLNQLNTIETQIQQLSEPAQREQGIQLEVKR